MEPPALLSADHDFSSETFSPPLTCASWLGTVIVNGPLQHGLHRLGIRVVRRVGTTATGNEGSRQCPNQMFQFLQQLFQTGSVTTPTQFRTRSFFATFSQPHGPPRVGWPGKMLQVSGSQTLREKVLMTTVSDAYPTENFKASFSSSPFLKQCSSVICFAISGVFLLGCRGSSYAWPGTPRQA